MVSRVLLVFDKICIKDFALGISLSFLVVLLFDRVSNNGFI